ncbi:MAG: hypothetical protein V5A68_07540 [Candidatus Thermoplasmatota archaeon]
MDREEKIIQVNYWKRLRKDFDNIVGNLHGIAIVIHNSIDFKDIVDFLNKVRKKEKNTVLYISLINSYNRVKNTLREFPLKNKNIFVIDCVSVFLDDKEDTEKCRYRKPPENLKELEQLIERNINRTNPNILMIDSISQFINLSMPSDEELTNFYRFLHDLRKKISGLNEDSIILLYNNRMGLIKNLPVMNVDLILKLEVIKEKVNWKS